MFSHIIRNILYIWKNYIMNKVLTVVLLLIQPFLWSQSELMPEINDFIEQQSGFEENDAGEITPLNEKEINKVIKFKIEAEFPQVEIIRNIIWDSYSTFVSPFKKYHYHTFIVQVKMPDVERFRYLDVKYNPYKKEAETDFTWNKELGDFELRKPFEEEEEE